MLADFLFTATAVVAQPATGIALAQQSGIGLTERWVLWSLALYVIAGVFWLPVVFIQRRMRDLAGSAAVAGSSLPAEYHRLFHIWFWFGLPGFGSVAAILWLMIAKPAL